MKLSRLALAAALALPAVAAGWADRGEYDLVMGIRTEASAQKRIELLDRWQAKYPQSEFRQMRRELYLAAYESLGDGARMLKVAREMLDEKSGSPVGIYWCTVLVPELRDPPADILDVGDKAAHQMLMGSYSLFGAKPAGVADDEWKKRQASGVQLAHRTLGWIAWQRKDYPAAAREFSAYLEKDPGSAEIAAWLGMVSALQKEPEKRSAALWYLQRAASLRGEGALSDDQRRLVGNLADDVYAAYHGDNEGLDKLKAAVAAGAAPPADFRVETAAVVAARRADEEMLRNNPQLAAWLRIRRQLESPEGEKALADLRAAPLPKLKGTVIRAHPEAKPSEVVLGLSQPFLEEVVLRVSPPFPNGTPPGTEVEFEGNIDSFVKQPFSLIVLADRDKITGWPNKK